jgi:hypothetical protein
VVGNHRTMIGRSHPPEGNPMVSEEARVRDDKLAMRRNERNRKAATVVQIFGNLMAVGFEARGTTYISEPRRLVRRHDKRK